MLYLLESGDPSGSHALSTVEGPAGLDLDALWGEFNVPIDDHAGDAPDVAERSLWWAWYDRRQAHLRETHLYLTGRAAEDAADTFLLTRVFAAWLCRYHGCTRPETTSYGTEL